MRVAFIHDTILIRQSNCSYYSLGFTYELWKRYLEVFDNLLVVTRSKNQDNKEDISQRYKLSSGKNVTMLPFDNNKNFLDMVKAITNSIKMVDGVIIRLPSLSGVVAYFVCKKYHKPFFIELVGCPWDALWNHSVKGKLIAPFMFLFTKYIVIKSTYVLYVTNQFLQKRYPTNGKELACSDIFIANCDKSILQRTKTINNNSIFKLGTVGGLNVRYKGYDQVIRMMSILKEKNKNNIEYHLIGGGNSDWIKKIAIKHKVLEKVIIHGPLPHNKVIDLMDNLDIYIQPSLQEGMPRALLEAMSRGCPCIGSDVGGIPELLDRSCIYKRKKINQLTDTYLSLIKKNNMEQQSQKNFRKAMEFSSDILNKKRRDFYQEFKNSIK